MESESVTINVDLHTTVTHVQAYLILELGIDSIEDIGQLNLTEESLNGYIKEAIMGLAASPEIGALSDDETNLYVTQLTPLLYDYVHNGLELVPPSGATETKEAEILQRYEELKDTFISLEVFSQGNSYNFEVANVQWHAGVVWETMSFSQTQVDYIGSTVPASDTTGSNTDGSTTTNSDKDLDFDSSVTTSDNKTDNFYSTGTIHFDEPSLEPNQPPSLEVNDLLRIRGEELIVANAGLSLADPELDAKDDYRGASLSISLVDNPLLSKLGFNMEGASFSIDGTELKTASGLVFATFSNTALDLININFLGSQPVAKMLANEVLQRVQYENISHNFVPNIDAGSIQFIFNDGDGGGVTVTRDATLGNIYTSIVNTSPNNITAQFTGDSLNLYYDFVDYSIAPESGTSISSNNFIFNGHGADDTLTLSLMTAPPGLPGGGIWDNSINVVAGTGDDVVRLYFTGSTIASNDVRINGSEGNDTLSLAIEGNWMWANFDYYTSYDHPITSDDDPTTNSDFYSVNQIVLKGGDGDDILDYSALLNEYSSSAYHYSMYVKMLGGAGNDTISMSLFDDAWGQGHTYWAWHGISSYVLKGGDGIDSVYYLDNFTDVASFDMLIEAENIDAKFYCTNDFDGNNISLKGGMGHDNLSFELNNFIDTLGPYDVFHRQYWFGWRTFYRSEAGAGATGNTFEVNGYSGDDKITFNINDFRNGMGRVQPYGNEIFINAGNGNDEVNSIFNYAAGFDYDILPDGAYTARRNSEINAEGRIRTVDFNYDLGNGSDTLNLEFNLRDYRNNEVDVQGGDGSDIIDVAFQGVELTLMLTELLTEPSSTKTFAHVTHNSANAAQTTNGNLVTTVAHNVLESFINNTVTIDGGTGNDQIDFSLRLGEWSKNDTLHFSDNSILISGGEGSDTISISGLVYGPNNNVKVKYDQAGDEIDFILSASAFSGLSSLGARIDGSFSNNAYWSFSNNKVLYDTNGSLSGGELTLVSFSNTGTDLSLTQDEIINLFSFV